MIISCFRLHIRAQQVIPNFKDLIVLLLKPTKKRRSLLFLDYVHKLRQPYDQFSTSLFVACFFSNTSPTSSKKD